MNIEEYRAIISELMDEFPAELLQELNGGVIVSDSARTASTGTRTAEAALRVDHRSIVGRDATVTSFR